MSFLVFWNPFLKKGVPNLPKNFSIKGEENRIIIRDSKYLIDDIPEDLRVDHAFECVGGKKSEDAIEQIIEYNRIIEGVQSNYPFYTQFIQNFIIAICWQ